MLLANLLAANDVSLAFFTIALMANEIRLNYV